MEIFLNIQKQISESKTFETNSTPENTANYFSPKRKKKIVFLERRFGPTLATV